MKRHLLALRNKDRAEVHTLDQPRPKRSLNPDSARALRAANLVKDGYVSRAVRALLHTGLAPMTRRTQRQLSDLHPRQSAPAPPLPDNAPLTTCDKEVVHKLVREYLCNGSAPAYSGWTGELLRALVDDEDCLAGITAVVDDILNGRLSDYERDYILTGNLIAGRKRDGSSVRPIAMGEAFYKLAGHYGLYLVNSKLVPLLEPIQLAHSPGGPERAVHLLQSRLELGSPNSILLKVDFTNAFNTLHRSVILRELFARKELGSLWRLASWVYGSPSTLLLLDQGTVAGSMLSQEGVRQGCVLAAALFSIGTISIFNQCVQQHPDVHAVAIMDDLTLYGPQDSVLRCFDTLLQALQGTGLALNLAKNKVLWPSTSEPPSALFDSIKARGLSLELGSMEILGTMVGLDDKKIQTWISRLSNPPMLSYSRLFYMSISQCNVPWPCCVYALFPR